MYSYVHVTRAIAFCRVLAHEDARIRRRRVRRRVSSTQAAQAPSDSQGLWEAHEQYRLCVCGSPRGDLSHIASLTLGCSRKAVFALSKAELRQGGWMGGGPNLTAQLS
jgi:hypothetical protein